MIAKWQPDKKPGYERKNNNLRDVRAFHIYTHPVPFHPLFSLL